MDNMEPRYASILMDRYPLETKYWDQCPLVDGKPGELINGS